MARTIDWSGYTWTLRTPGRGGPGPCDWSDSTDNASVNSSGELVLAQVKDASGKWTCPELHGPHLGYGTYTWTVNTDLTKIDSHEVLGLFTYDWQVSGSHNEIDIEPSHWGNLSWPDGSVTVWQNADTNENISKSYRHTPFPPYTLSFEWTQGKIRWLIKDANASVLLDYTVTSGVPTPAKEIVMMNFWRFNNVAPAGRREQRVKSFVYTPVGQTPPAPPTPPATVTAILPLLKQGSAGTAVKTLQVLLRERTGKFLSSDGIFGGGTATALKNFQSSKGLASDGTTTGKTWERLTKG